jgi:hypothetical protein
MDEKTIAQICALEKRREAGEKVPDELEATVPNTIALPLASGLTRRRPSIRPPELEPVNVDSLKPNVIYNAQRKEVRPLKKGGAIKMASGGMTASKRADGIAIRGKTHGKIC